MQLRILIQGAQQIFKESYHLGKILCTRPPTNLPEDGVREVVGFRDIMERGEKQAPSETSSKWSKFWILEGLKINLLKPD